MNKEQEEYFTKLGELQYWYFLLDQKTKEMESSNPKSPLDAMIDDATGFTDARLKQMLPEIFKISENIIRLKKFLGEKDYHEGEAKLKEMKKLYRKQFLSK